MKKISLLLIMLSILLTGCSKVVNEKVFEDNAKVINVEYHKSYTTTSMIISGKSLIPITTTHPERHHVVVEYKGIEFKLNDEKSYDIAKDNIGNFVKCNFKEFSYDDGTIIREVEKVIDVQ